MSVRETRLRPYSCPTCQKGLDAASGFGDSRPTPGCLSICAYCAEFLVFPETLSVRKMELSEELALPSVEWMALCRLRQAILFRNKK